MLVSMEVGWGVWFGTEEVKGKDSSGFVKDRREEEMRKEEGKDHSLSIGRSCICRQCLRIKTPLYLQGDRVIEQCYLSTVQTTAMM